MFRRSSLLPLNRFLFWESRTHVWFAWVVVAATTTLYFILARYYPLGYLLANYEDMIGEWTQFMFMAFTMAASARLAWVISRYRLFFTLLALAAFYTVMEEISWGQRLVGFDSPDFFQSKNLQSETNVHNILVGPFDTLLKDSMRYTMAGALSVYGFVFPLAVRLKWSLALMSKKLGLVTPPLYLCPFFICASYLELEWAFLNEAEVAELLVGMALSLMCVHYLFAEKRGLDPDDGSSWSHRDSVALTFRFYTTVSLLIFSGFTTAFIVYGQPAQAELIDSRLRKGINMFAKRLTNDGRWDLAIEMHSRLLKSYPEDTGRMRELATVYRKSGQRKKFEQFAERALEVDLAHYEKYPDHATSMRNLVRSYRLLGNDAEAEEYLQLAFAKGLDRINLHPENAVFAISMGKTYELAGMHDEALIQYERGHKLNPQSERFRRYYLKAKERRRRRK